MATPTLTLNDLSLNPNLIWKDRHLTQSIKQTVARTIGGRIVTWVKQLDKGNSITLVGDTDTGWLTLAQIQALEVMANIPGGVFTLNLNGDTHQVMFRHHEPPAFDATPFVPRLNEGDPDSIQPDYFMSTIKLMTV